MGLGKSKLEGPRRKRVLIYIALFDYEKRSERDMTFSKGDLLEVLPPVEGRDWLTARNMKNKEKGLVPAMFVAEKGSLQAEEWFFEKATRKEAEELIMIESNPVGTFIVRPSEKMTNMYSITVKDKDESYDEAHPKNYRIKIDSRGNYFISPAQKFKSVKELILAYQKPSSNCKLIYPCPKAIPQLWDLAPDLQDSWEIPRYEVQLLRQIGSGQFGEVYYGKWRKTINVAVKTLKPGSMTPQAFLEEAAIMKTFRHRQLIALYAVCSREEPMYIITEFMSNGSLLDYLRKCGPQIIKLGHLIYIVAQVASGMAYLESKNLVHRDLAARNILVGENNTAKVADFGLARVFNPCEAKSSGNHSNMLPVKWTAPEAFRLSQFSTKSDVWSFGIVLYETFTYGEKPYLGMSAHDVVIALKNGYRMPKPRNHQVPDEVYEKMLECWKEDPASRPTFEFLKDFFENYETSTEDVYT